MRLPDPGRSRAVLVGASRFSHPDLPDLPAVRNNLTALEAILTSPDGTGLPPAHCSVLADLSEIAAVGSALEDVAGFAEDVLIVYYAGHGLVEPRSGELYLTLPDTKPDLVRWTGLPFAHVRETLLDARAEVRVLLLDCCFSGRAIQAMAATASVISGQIDIAGTYTITASPANTPANAPEGEQFTAFSGELISWLRDGDPAAPELLSLGDTYLHLLRTLRNRGLPQPQQHGTRTANWIALAPNSAHVIRYGAPVSEEATPGDPEALGTFEAATRSTDAMTSGYEVETDTIEALDEVADGDSVKAMIDRGYQAENEQKHDDAWFWYEKAARADSTLAMRCLAYLAQRWRKLDEAETWYTRAAKAGDTEAMQELAELCKLRAKIWENKRRGADKARRYWVAAEEWLRKAAAAGDGSATHRLGRFLMAHGRHREAELYFREGVESGDTGAMCSLAELLSQQNRLDEAESWYRRSAETGNELAMYEFGQFLEWQGKIRSAESWYRMAAEKDYVRAGEALNRIIEQNPWLR